jgi:hypothetical protein
MSREAGRRAFDYSDFTQTDVCLFCVGDRNLTLPDDFQSSDAL